MPFKYFDFIKPYKGKILIVFLLYLITLLCSVCIPYVLGDVISTLEKGKYSSSYTLKAFLIILTLYFVWNFINAIVSVKFSKINKMVETDIRMSLYDKLFNSRISTFNELKDGEILNRISKDTERLEDAFMNLFYLSISFLYCFLLILFMFNLNALLSLVILGLFALIVLSQRLLSKPLETLYKGYKKTEDELINEIKTNMTSFMNIKLFDMKESILNIFASKTKNNLDSYLDVSKRINLIKNLNYFLAALFKISPIFIGAILYSKSMITIGCIFAMYSYAIQLASELRSIIEADIVLKDIKTSYVRIQEVVNILASNNKLKNPNPFKLSNLSFKGTSFYYGDKLILNNINNSFKKGDVVLLAGENGAGKSTFLHLICGILNNETIYYNDIPQTNLSEEDILKEVSYMLQQGYLFPTSIINNITCFNKALEAKALEVCRDLGIERRILKLAEGYETQVNEKNTNLSGGEKQLISLARTLIRESSIIILDEPNSALDNNVEDIIKGNLTKYFKDKIVFIISHKGNLAQVCNRRLYLKEGNLLEVSDS